MPSHELDSVMLYVHPPLSIIGYVFIFIFAFALFRFEKVENRMAKTFAAAAWLFTFLGLVTGMIWAQVAWGSFWSWDPKETLTLGLFLLVSASQVAYIEKRRGAGKVFALFACAFSILTISSSFIIAGLHSFA